MKTPIPSRRGGWRHGSPGRQRGVSIVLLALALFMLLGFTALSVDGGNLFVAKNELHNAADAGSLAGARMLYTADGSSVNSGANQVATDAAQANNSQNSASEVVSALRGHWSFATRTFTPDDSLEPVNLSEKSTAELDQYDPFDPFINAVEVVTARQQPQVEAFFGRIFGFEGYDVSARSVAYIGFAGTLRPEDVDMPIAICKDAITNPDGNFTCNVGRMISSNDETGGWTNYSHELTGGASANDLKKIMADGGSNPDELFFGKEIETVKGQLADIYTDFYNKWSDTTGKSEPWTLTLPVIDCSDGIQPSSPLVGTVEIHVVWVVDKNSQKVEDEAPEEMRLHNMEDPAWDDWENNSSDGVTRWSSFVDHFGLVEDDGDPAEWRQRTIYFLPSCSVHEPKGQTGGGNFGILARIPVLVD
ncbi:TadG family pilus assembly protein [Halomonas alkalisoli]|uniref:TadG family pilus assembly protein n=1 Tax=Halomonas alkalisoli TaxID=2907158 RepID=UPI001F43AF8B|nr:TadG family pilus assembly protein [Halomonas alkalisoli]MCE9680782.1 pilus assembly protein TadG-related protein [Halomonas alkalisoli]